MFQANYWEATVQRVKQNLGTYLHLASQQVQLNRILVHLRNEQQQKQRFKFENSNNAIILIRNTSKKTTKTQ